MLTQPAGFPLQTLPDEKVAWIRNGNLFLHPALVGQEHARAYRYATLAEATALVRDGIWTFLRPTKSPDKYEQHVSTELFGDDRHFGAFPGYVKCVSLEYSSEAMWRTYATTGGLVRISWPLRELLSVLGAAKCNSPTSTVIDGRSVQMSTRGRSKPNPTRHV
jgi:hypothetical protein